MPPLDPSIRRYVANSHLGQETKKLLLGLLDRGVRMRKTKSGLVIYADDGVNTVGTHMGPSDRNAHRSLAADLRRIGLIQKETS